MPILNIFWFRAVSKRPDCSAVQKHPKQFSPTSVLQLGVIKSMDVLDNVIAIVINDSCGCLKVSVCTVSTFYSELQHLSTARRFFFFLH